MCIRDSIGNRGAANFTFEITGTQGITYSGVSAWSTNGSGINAVFDVVIDNLGAFTTLTATNRGQNFALSDQVTITDATLGGQGAGGLVMDVASIQGHQYNGVAPTSNGNGENATFNITIDGTGAASAIVVANAGQEHQIGNVFTVTDAQIGNFGGTNLTFDVASLAAIQYTNISASGGSGVNASINVNVAANGATTIEMNKTGRNYKSPEVLTVTDSQLGNYGYSNITFNIASVINVFDQTKQNNGTASLYNATNAIIDSTIKKFGTDSIKFQAENHYSVTDLSLIHI